MDSGWSFKVKGREGIGYQMDSAGLSFKVKGREGIRYQIERPLSRIFPES